MDGLCKWKAKIPDGTFHSDRPFTIYIKSSNKRPFRISVPSHSLILCTSNETTKDVHSFRHALLDFYIVLVYDHVEHVKY